MPDLQERETEDNSSDEDSMDSYKYTHSNKNNTTGKGNATEQGNKNTDITKYLALTTDAFIPFSIQKEINEEKRNTHNELLCRSETKAIYEELIIPKLISRIDNDDESTSTSSSSYGYKTDLPRIRSTFTIANTKTIEIPEMIETSIQDIYCDSDDESSFNNYIIPTMRIRGGDGVRTNEIENDHDGTSRFRLDHLDDIESEPIGNTMGTPRLPGMIRFSGCNPNSIKSTQVKSTLQHSIDLEIDVQCYSEVNQDFLKTQQ